MTIPEKELTFQYDSLDDQGNETNNPKVADGTEIKVYAESMKEIFQKEPQFQSIQRSPEDKFKGNNTIVTDTMKAKHKFEITGWVYNSSEKKFSLDSSIRDANDNGQKATETITTDELDVWVYLGDTEIEYDSETVSIKGGSDLSRGTDYEMDYTKGRIKFLSGGSVNTTTKTREILPGVTYDETVVTDDFEISYTFNGTPVNIAKLLKRMSQLGGVAVMRKNKQSFSAPQGDTSAANYTVVPLKVQIVEKSSKPDEVKVEMEVRVASEKGA